MAEGSTQTAAAKMRERPLSPHLQIWHWTVTMAASITHRATGMALAAGTLLLAWWLIAAATGADAYADFAAIANHPIGEIILGLFVWALSFHLLNGIRHLFWDTGMGFKIGTAKITAVLVYLFSVLIAGAIFALVIMDRGGMGQ